MKDRLAIILTHPIQYYAPLFKCLTKRGVIEIKVFYTWEQAVGGKKYDHGFGKTIEWDIPLLEGYEYEFLKNTSSDPGSHHFLGIDNPGIIESIKAYNPEAILVFGWNFKSHLKVLRHFKSKIKLLFRGDSTLLDEQQGLKKILRKLFLKWIYSHIDTALYVGKSNYDYFVEFGLGKEQLIWAPHAIDNERFQLNEALHASRALEFKTSLGMDEKAFVFLFAGKFESKKDPLLLLSAFSEAKLNDNAHLVFIGNGVLEDKLKSISKDNANVHFMNFQNQQSMPAVYRMADVFVLPSKGPGETWGLAINEAMACGRPVLVSEKCGGAVNLVDDGRNGYIFKAGDMHDLRSKMEMLFQENDQLKDYGNASLEKIKFFSLEKVSVAIEEATTGIRVPGSYKADMLDPVQ